ncbi:thermonuclease family protein [Roseibium sp.]|uniref:thermonuclease family protein n=1 Tax=Roseibium sp. TaxID=1936156 RepID=UPI003A98614F
MVLALTLPEMLCLSIASTQAASSGATLLAPGLPVDSGFATTSNPQKTISPPTGSRPSPSSCVADLRAEGMARETVSPDPTPIPLKPVARRGFLLFEADDGRRFSLAEIVSAGLPEEASAAVSVQSGLSQDLDPPFFAVIAGPENRWGIQPAWITDRLGRLVQTHLLRQGRAFVAPQVSSSLCWAELKQAENAARTTRAGLWTTAFPLPSQVPADILHHTGRFVVIEGPVVSLGKTNKTSYLNFGRHWNSDLTATIMDDKAPLFRETLEQLGRYPEYSTRSSVRVRLRGMVTDQDGPLIILTHPAQLEILELMKDAE